MEISSNLVAFSKNTNFKYETIETHARAFLTLNISSIGTVSDDSTAGHICMNVWTKIKVRYVNSANSSFKTEVTIHILYKGEGHFGKVVKAKMIIDEIKMTVAVKTLHSNPQRIDVENLMSELKIMIHLGSHPNIVNVLGACTTQLRKQELYVVVEYCEHGDIVDVLRRHKQAFR